MSKRILSVNGNEAMNYLLHTIFKKEYELVPVKEIYEVIHQLKANRQIELIIVDLDFQTKQSWELVEHIKTSKLFNLPVILLATAKSEETERKCYEYSIDEIFFKPFNPMELTLAVKSIVSNILSVNV